MVNMKRSRENWEVLLPPLHFYKIGSHETVKTWFTCWWYCASKSGRLLFRCPPAGISQQPTDFNNQSLPDADYWEVI